MKDYKGMRVYYLINLFLIFKCFFMMFPPNCPKSAKGKAFHTIFLSSPIKEPCQLSIVSLPKKGSPKLHRIRKTIRRLIYFKLWSNCIATIALMLYEKIKQFYQSGKEINFHTNDGIKWEYPKIYLYYSSHIHHCMKFIKMCMILLVYHFIKLYLYIVRIGKK